jgi:hypothetical protein
MAAQCSLVRLKVHVKLQSTSSIPAGRRNGLAQQPYSHPCSRYSCLEVLFLSLIWNMTSSAVMSIEAGQGQEEGNTLDPSRHQCTCKMAGKCRGHAHLCSFSTCWHIYFEVLVGHAMSSRDLTGAACRPCVAADAEAILI